MRQSVLFLLASWILVAGSCRPSAHKEPVAPPLHPWISSYTTGTISRTASLAVIFDRARLGEKGLPETLPEDAFELEPAVPGRLERAADNMLVFEPAQWLQPATLYTATLYLDRLGLPVGKALRTFRFSVQTRPLQWSLASLTLEPAEAQQMRLQGQVRTTDAVEAEEVEARLNIQLDGVELHPKWTHDADQMNHYFTVQGIERTDRAGTLELRLSPPHGPLLRRTLEVPEKGRFELSELRVVRSDPPYLELRFTNALDSDQPLDGLIRLDNDIPLKFIREGALLQVFPSGILRGQMTLYIDSALRDAYGKTLGTPHTRQITFAMPRPALALVTDGVIVPRSGKTLLPFRAVMLKGVVVEVFRIHSHNVLQFLQTNALNESYNLGYVGRIVAQQEIELLDAHQQAEATQWRRYAIDLSSLIEPDPGAIYEVRIGFLPQHSLYPCSAPLEPYFLPEPVDGQYQSIMDWWTSPFGWYEGYEWQDRDRPCKPAYFNSDRFLRTQVLASHIGLIAKRGLDGRLTVVATDLRTAQPLAGAQVEVLDLQQSLLATATTDGEGMASVQTSRQPWFVRVRQGEDVGYLRLDESESLQTSRFDVAGQQTQRGLKGFIYGERGVWRPGDSLYLHFMLDDRRNPLPDDFPLKAELRDPRGRLAWRGLLRHHLDHIYPIRLATRPDDPPGLWRLSIRVGAALFRKDLRIEAIKPNRLKIALEAGAEPLGIWQEPHRLQLDVQWLHGTPARQARVVVELRTRDRHPTFEGYRHFSFFDPTRRSSPLSQKLFDGFTDDEGRASFTHTFARPDNLLAGMLDLDFQVRAFEPGGNYSLVHVRKAYHPRTTYAGIRIPENSYGWKYFPAGSEVPLEFVSLGADGKPRANRRLDIGLYQVGRYWWSEVQDELRRFASSDHAAAFQKATVTTDDKGRARWTLQTQVSGRLLVRVCDPESGHCAGDYLYLSAWHTAAQVSKEEAAMMVFGTDKEEYAPGETVHLTVPAPDNGRILVSLENGSGLMRTFWHEATRGDNRISFEVTPEMAPTTYISVMLLQPHAQVPADLPMRLYGIAPISVRDPTTVLQPEIELPTALRPTSKARIRVREASGRAMSYTLAVVDEGLLDLTAFSTPDPHAAFYAREALGVRTWDLYDYVAGASNGSFDRILAIGGDAELKPPSAKARANRFEPLVRVLGPFHLPAGQRQTHEIDIPNYIGSVRAMVVATNGQGAYGHAEATSFVRQPLMVLGTLPRVLGPGERLQLPVTVFAMDEALRQVEVRLSESNGMARLSRPSQTFAAKAPEERTLYFPVELAADRTGIARFHIEAVSGRERATHTVEIEVRNPLPLLTEVSQQTLQAGQVQQLAIESPRLAGTQTALLELSSLPPLELARLSRYLVAYPYGCAEQTASAAMAQLLLPQMSHLPPDLATQCRINVEHALERLARMQRASGAFAMWPEGGSVHPWVDLWVGHFLLEAQRQGVAVSPPMLERWLTHAAQEAASGQGGTPLTQAYRLYLLALAGKAHLSAMNFLRQQPQLDPMTRMRLAAAYALVGQKAAAAELTADIRPVAVRSSSWADTYGSELRELAAYLEAFTWTDAQTMAWDSWLQLSEKLQNRSWVSTQDAAWILLAAARYLEKWPPQKGQAQCRILLDGQPQTIGLDKGSFQLLLPEKVRKLELHNTGNQTLHVRLVQQRQPSPGQEPVEARNIEIHTLFLDENGNRLQPERLPQGTSFYCHTQVSWTQGHTFELDDLALVQIFPSGWEILPDPQEGLTAGQATISFREKRDDRVQTFFGNWNSHARAPNTSLTFTVRVQATYEGRFYLPGAACEAMYDGAIKARERGRWVEVVPVTEMQ